MDLRTKLATAFTLAVVIAVVGWTTANPLTHSVARRTINRVDRTKSSLDEFVRLTTAVWELPEHVHQPTKCDVKLVVDPTLASHPAPSGGSGRFGKRTGRSVAKSAFEIRCSARATKDGSVALWVWFGTWSANEWFEFVIAPTARAGSMLTAETDCYIDIQEIGVDHSDQIRGCPFVRVEGTLRLRSVPLVPGERVPFELALRVDQDGGGFDWAVEAAADVLVER